MPIGPTQYLAVLEILAKNGNISTPFAINLRQHEATNISKRGETYNYRFSSRETLLMQPCPNLNELPSIIGKYLKIWSVDIVAKHNNYKASHNSIIKALYRALIDYSVTSISN